MRKNKKKSNESHSSTEKRESFFVYFAAASPAPFSTFAGTQKEASISTFVLFICLFAFVRKSELCLKREPPSDNLICPDEHDDEEKMEDGKRGGDEEAKEVEEREGEE